MGRDQHQRVLVQPLTILSVLAAACVLWVPLPLSAQLPVTTINAVFPPGAQAGSTVEVTVSGPAARRLEKLVFSHSGITAEVVRRVPDEFADTPEPSYGHFRVTVAKDVPPGTYDVRAIGAWGISNPRAFVVSDRPELVVKGTPVTPENAYELPIGAVANGRIPARSHHFFKTHLEQGQRVTVRLAAQQIDSRLSAVLTLFDTSGRRLAQAFTVERDPVLLFEAPKKGDYLIRLHDETYGGGEEYFYRLVVDEEPFVATVKPLAATPHEERTFTWLGWNLPQGKPSPFRWQGRTLVAASSSASAASEPVALLRPWIPQFPSLLVSGAPGLAVTSPAGRTVALGVAQGTVVVETESSEVQIQRLDLPCDVSGSFYPEGDEDQYEFEAQKGKQYWIEVLSHRLGADTDPAFLLQRLEKDPKGNVRLVDIAFVDDPPDRNATIRSPFHLSSDDPALLWTAPADGTYRLWLRDQFGSVRNDPRAVYRLVIREPHPECRIVAVPQELRTANNNTVPVRPLVLRRGESLAVRLLTEIRGGFDREVTVEALGLPQGVKAEPVTWKTSSGTQAWLVLQATHDAPASLSSVQLKATSRVGNDGVEHPVTLGEIATGTRNQPFDPARVRPTSSWFLQVRDDGVAVPVVLRGDPSDVHGQVGSDVKLRVKAERTEGFADPVAVSVMGLPREIPVARATIAKNKSDVELTLSLKNGNLRPGTYTFWVRGDLTKVKRPFDPQALALAEARQKRLAAAVQQLSKELEEARKALKEAKEEANRSELAKRVAALEERHKKAVALKKQADAQVASAKKEAAPRDTNFAVVTMPLKLRVDPRPSNPSKK